MKYIQLVLIITISAFVLSFIFLEKEWPLVIFAKVFKINSSSFIEEEFQNSYYRLSKPEDYNPQENTKYPLVVYLHGSGENGNDNSRQIEGLDIVGNGFNKLAKDFKKLYPSFVYVPQCPKGESWSGMTLALTIESIQDLIKKYPIDTNRLYLIGYSMGGSGSYALASQYYLTTKQPFAAVVRLSGQGTFARQTHEILAKSSVWLHIGLHDDQIRVEKARKAYKLLKGMVPNATEETEPITIKNHPGTTWTVLVNDKEKVKRSEYINDGHGISGFPFNDPALMKWVFKQRYNND